MRAFLYWLIGRHLSLPPLVQSCARCKGDGYDPQLRDDDDYPSIPCTACHGVGKELTEAGRQVAEVDSIMQARVDAQLEIRYGDDNPNDPRRFT